ncbi:MAG TPA: sugar ABC transporter permease, partial [Firmicutes bacterium]|nr:sugar ABC transporter permease [Bacillota bacterium]
RQTLGRITIPLMLPVIAVNVIWAVISSLKQMETIYLTTNGGPGNASQFLANYLYIKAFDAYEFAYGNAVSVLFVAVCLITTVVLNKCFKKEYY